MDRANATSARNPVSVTGAFALDRTGHGWHVRSFSQNSDRQRMTRGLPYAISPPVRANLLRGTLVERNAQATLGDRADLSLTVAIEDPSLGQRRRFAFRLAREGVVGETAQRKPHIGQAPPVVDQRPDTSAPLDQADAHSSTPLLAGAIAQSRPSPMQHNAPYREAAGAYRRSDSLGVAGARLGIRSDKRI